MLLYHGSNVAVERPRLFKTDRRVDFGSGFYLTSSLEQACNWARTVTRRRGDGVPLVSVFEFDDGLLDTLRVRTFGGPDAEWLHFVGDNRHGDIADDGLDLVIGPVANDNTMPTLRLFFGGVYTEEEAIRRLLPQKLHDQYAFKTPAALAALRFCEVIEA